MEQTRIRHRRVGLEHDQQAYIHNLCGIILRIKRALKPTGSFRLNIGDAYHKKRLLGIPWRVALELTDRQVRILRNSVIENRVKDGMDAVKDRRFVKRPKDCCAGASRPTCGIV